MKPVSGFVVSSKPISLKKASGVLSRFMSSETGTSNEISAYLRRASDAFVGILDVHDQIKESSVQRSQRRRRTTSEEVEVEAEREEEEGFVDGGLKGPSFNGLDEEEEEKSRGFEDGNENNKKKKKRKGSEGGGDGEESIEKGRKKKKKRRRIEQES
ncbi:hypothetical protein QJS04_geneDACA015801 [Acorus gramineus]|uniref:Uncharacterized protein n=1 Tax=Acorus gramineus TaxID=55184 RepID=A0AAV9BPJ2_ACOGR|nr:hypothetical protein QJS04_geneDACA015801 [Acorus gramineus]